MFANVYNVNKTEQSGTTTSRLPDFITPNSSRKSTIENTEKVDPENFYPWGATREIMEVIRRRTNSP